MRSPPYNVKSAKQTGSSTIASDLDAQARQLGIASQVAEDALGQRVARHKVELLRAEIRQDLEAANSYMAEHGSFAELVRQRDHERDEGGRGVDRGGLKLVPEFVDLSRSRASQSPSADRAHFPYLAARRDPARVAAGVDLVIDDDLDQDLEVDGDVDFDPIVDLAP